MTCLLIIFGPIAANLALLTLWANSRLRPAAGELQHYHPAPARTVPPAHQPPPALPAYNPAPVRIVEPVLSLGPIRRPSNTVPPFATGPLNARQAISRKGIRS